MTDMEKLTDVVHRLADGATLPVTTHTFTNAAPGPSFTIEQTAAPAVGDTVPEVEEPVDFWACPGCGLAWDEIPVGHAWSLAFNPNTGERRGYTCSDPTVDGAQALRDYMAIGRRLADGASE